MEYKRVREQALLNEGEICGNCTRFNIHGNKRYPCQPDNCPRYQDRKQAAQAQLDKALKTDGIEIRADDQSLPSIELFAGSASMAEVASMLSKSVDIAGQLREAGFKKVIPKEEK